VNHVALKVMISARLSSASTAIISLISSRDALRLPLTLETATPRAAVALNARMTATTGGSGSFLRLKTSHASPAHGGLHMHWHTSLASLPRPA